MNDLVPRGLWNFPNVFPSLMEDFGDLMPGSNFLSGLSISEDEKKVYVEASVPGLEPKDLEVTFSEGLLTIKGQRKDEEKGKTFRRKATRSFFYQFKPVDIDQTVEPQATSKNGVMTVTFAKLPVAKNKKISVKAA